MKELRTEFEKLVKVLGDNCICVKERCGCETSAPVIRIRELIQELENGKA